MSKFGLSLQMRNAVQDGADVTGNRCGFNGDPFAVVDQPAIEGQGEGSLGGFDAGMKCGKILNQNERTRLCAVIKVVAAAELWVGTDNEPVWTHRNLCTEAGMACGFNTEGSGRGFRVKEITQGSAFNQRETSGWCSLAIEGCRTDVSGVEEASARQASSISPLKRGI